MGQDRQEPTEASSNEPPKGRKAFVPRWRSHLHDSPQDSPPVAPESTRFQPRWRRNLASDPTPSVEPPATAELPHVSGDTAILPPEPRRGPRLTAEFHWGLPPNPGPSKPIPLAADPHAATENPRPDPDLTPADVKATPADEPQTMPEKAQAASQLQRFLPPPIPEAPAIPVARPVHLQNTKTPSKPKPQVKVKAKPKIKAPKEPRVAQEEVTNFTRQLAVMLNAGLPLVEALNFFAESIPGPLARVVDEVTQKVSAGTSLSHAMSQFPGVFSEVYIGLVELGETSSSLDEALQKLADLLEKQLRLAKRLQAALLYPAFLVGASMASVVVFLRYVLPTMIPLFQSFSMTLPWPTRVLLFSRHLVLPGGILLLAGIVGWTWLGPAWIRARRSKARWAFRLDSWLFRLPILGGILLEITVARMLFALTTMLEAGLPLLPALKSCETVVSNLALAQRLERARLEIQDGQTVTEAFQLHEVLPAACIHLLSAGEESARLSEMMQYTARFYEEQVDQNIDSLMSLLEPIIMGLLGLVVGFIVISAVLPTVQLINHLGA